MAAAGEIVVTDDALASWWLGLEIDSGAVDLKGIAGEVRIHRLR